jgi:glutamyl-tRNA synthetase
MTIPRPAADAAPLAVRFAPSPTGPPHLGSLRTALFNWLLARSAGGRFILRIEDTDRTRLDPAAEDQMIAALAWLGLDWDEGPDIGGPHGPYRQSERLARYHATADRLVSLDAAYRPADEPGIIRLKTPRTGEARFDDVVRGEIRIAWGAAPQDPVLIKSDGYPTYHLAAVVDDAAMGITHVLRGEEWIPSTPLHLRIYEALGWDPPAFAHLPLVTDMAGQKLKKRDARSVALVYREEGYLPEAVMNYLALLGWHPGTEEEVSTPDELVAAFTLDRLSKAASAHDEDRLRWFNRQHIARLSPPELASRMRPYLTAAYPAAAERGAAWLAELAGVVQDELTTLADIVEAARFIFDMGEITPEAREALASEPSRPVLAALREDIAAQATLDAATSAALFRELRRRFKESRGWGGRAVMFPARAALTGRVRGPHLSDLAALLGRDECLQRIDRALRLV